MAGNSAIPGYENEGRPDQDLVVSKNWISMRPKRLLPVFEIAADDGVEILATYGIPANDEFLPMSFAKR
jgi:hypothetical protein